MADVVLQEQQENLVENRGNDEVPHGIEDADDNDAQGNNEDNIILIVEAENEENQNPQVVNQEVNDIEDTRLLEYLTNTGRGKEILKEYNLNHQLLPKTTRNKLVRLVIAREKEWQLRNITHEEQLQKFKISCQRFQILAREIVKIFQNENETTYFTAFKKVGRTRVPISGKLWDHFNYEKQRLRETGLLAAATKRNDQQPLNEVAQTNDDLNKLDYLKRNLEDWTTIEIYWKDTYDARRYQLASGISINDYISNLLCLQSERGHTLIEYDYSRLYPNNEIVSPNDWMKIKACIKQNLETVRRSLNAEAQGLIFSLLRGGWIENQEDFMVLYLLPYIISSQRSRKRKGDDNQRPFKLSVDERRETFILHIQTPADLQTSVTELKDKLRRRGETFQPLIVAVGPLNNITEFYIVINDEYYKKATILKALELALKIFFVFDCKYPETSNTLWLFVQKCLFNINLLEDLKNTSLNILIGRISAKLNT